MRLLEVERVERAGEEGLSISLLNDASIEMGRRSRVASRLCGSF